MAIEVDDESDITPLSNTVAKFVCNSLASLQEGSSDIKNVHVLFGMAAAFKAMCAEVQVEPLKVLEHVGVDDEKIC